MADFCRVCAAEMGFPGDDMDKGLDLEPEYGYWELCEGCGWVFVDGRGKILELSEDNLRKR
jgi:hypothetical protein